MKTFFQQAITRAQEVAQNGMVVTIGLETRATAKAEIAPQDALIAFLEARRVACEVIHRGEDSITFGTEREEKPGEKNIRRHIAAFFKEARQYRLLSQAYLQIGSVPQDALTDRQAPRKHRQTHSGSPQKVLC